MVLARDSTVAATVTAGTTRNAALDGSAVAPGTLAVVGHIATTKPQRSATLHLLHLSFNAYGGIARWQARYGEEITVVGNTASLGEVSLSAFTGGTTGATSGHVLYEEV
jgi:formylmethanofuran dehydrogenase subunit A